MFFINLFPAVLFSYGIYNVYSIRSNNYECGNEEPEYYPDDAAWFFFYSVLIVSYALELLIWLAVAVNALVHFLRRHGKGKVLHRSLFNDKDHRIEMYSRGCLGCLSILLRGKKGANDLKNAEELKDIAITAFEFTNNDAKMGIVLSDLYVGFKATARVQVEQRVEAVRKVSLQISEIKKSCNTDGVKTGEDESLDQDSISKVCKRTIFANQSNHRQSMLGLQAEAGGYEVVERNLLMHENETDMTTLADATKYVAHSVSIYTKLPEAIHDFFEGSVGEDPGVDPLCFHRPTETSFDDFALNSIGHPTTKLCYASLHNSLSATPYAILVDEKARAVVVTIRGTKSLEDMVIDLHCVAQELDDVGKRCGFDGKGHHCHKGILARCKWIFNDIKKRRALKRLYSNDSPYAHYRLIITGHSLGGGCACVLATMLRPSFPSLKCFAYEPAGCVFDEQLADFCEDFIICIVRHDDIVPRLSPANCDVLRDQFFEVMARVKVSKIKLFQDLRTPCPESSLARRNAAILRPKEFVNHDTAFYQSLQARRNERAEKNRCSGPRLYIPGRIIHLVDLYGDDSQYVPYWASKYEFNEIILSDRMASDHRAHVLIDILKDIRLDRMDDVIPPDRQLFQPIVINETIPETQARHFTCFSMPKRKCTWALAIWISVALILCFVMNNSCEFFTRDAVVSINGTEYAQPIMEFGLFSYELKRYTNDNGYDSTFEDTGICAPFPPAFHQDGYMIAARACANSTMVFGSISFALAWASTLLNLGRRAWRSLAMAALVATVCQGCVFLVLRTDLCTEKRNPLEDLLPDSASCSLSKSGKIAILAVCLWFLAAVGSLWMSRRVSAVQLDSDPLKISSMWE
eukprot:CAMPEP_0172302010 /NCGR_PEP_ID=MMETSP1058-20130122/3782_1 /TAXON_ID=83371 /ORGANISM="Detonula confervacea, Strain CCMP 353" /LENGTH=860 /DNA_ID=CAMNT_0013012335 /DNA_START=504 /DNA_END=3086 /DNA_ORIENTATION=-